MRVVVLIVLLTAHLALAYWCGHAEAVPPQLAMLMVQGMAVWAVFTRYRRSASLIRLPWLLLAVAVLMQMLWDSTNVLATVVGDKGGYLAALATVLSGLYVIPCMFMSTRSFTRHEPRIVAVLDLVLLCMVAVLVYEFFTALLSGPLAADPGSIYVVVYLADAIDFSLAAMAILRLFGARSFRWRHFYYVAGAYLLVNALVACIYNRIEMHGLPWWAGSLIDVPHALLLLVALRRPPRWLRAYHPSLGVSQTIASFAPIMLATMVVMLASARRVSITGSACWWGRWRCCSTVCAWPSSRVGISTSSEPSTRAPGGWSNRWGVIRLPASPTAPPWIRACAKCWKRGAEPVASARC